MIRFFIRFCFFRRTFAKINGEFTSSFLKLGIRRVSELVELLRLVEMSWPKDTLSNSHQTSENFELPPTPPTPSSLHVEAQTARSATGCETSWYHKPWSNQTSNAHSVFDIATDDTARLLSPPYVMNTIPNTDTNQNYRTCR